MSSALDQLKASGTVSLHPAIHPFALATPAILPLLSAVSRACFAPREWYDAREAEGGALAMVYLMRILADLGSFRR
jgi:hypothetical protein